MVVAGALPRRGLAQLFHGSGRIWLLSAGFTVVAAVLYGALVVDLDAAHEHGLPFITVVALFALAEVFVVHFEFRGDAQTFSLVEVPIVLGLLYTRPALVIPAQLIGAAVALAAYRKQPPIKLIFNLAAFALETCLAVLVFRAIASTIPMVDPTSPRTWAAAFAATAIASLTGNLAVFIAIALSGGAQTRAERVQSLAFGLGATVVTTSATLAIAVVAELDRAASWLLLAPIAAIYAAHRAHVAQRKEQRSLEFLHDSTGLLQRATDANWAVDTLLQRARLAFQSDVAALSYLPPGEPASVALVVLGPGEEHRALSALPRAAVWDAWSAVSGETGGLFVGHHDQLISGLTLRDGMVAPLHVDGGVVGYVLVASRLSDVSRFAQDDLRLLKTIAEHLAVGLDHGLLENPALQQRIFERQLAYRADHDPVTGLASPGRLNDKLVASPTAALIVIDIGDVSAIVGTESRTTDALALVIAERLRRCIRQDDLPARLDEGRYAVLAASGGDPEITGRVAQRIRDRLAAPVVVDGARLCLSPTVAVELPTGTASGAAVPGPGPGPLRRPLGAG